MLLSLWKIELLTSVYHTGFSIKVECLVKKNNSDFHYLVVFCCHTAIISSYQVQVLMWLYQSIKKISGSVAEFISHFLTRNLKKWGQKLISGNNFINKNSDDFYVLQL